MQYENNNNKKKNAEYEPMIKYEKKKPQSKHHVVTIRRIKKSTLHFAICKCKSIAVYNAVK